MRVTNVRMIVEPVARADVSSEPLTRNLVVQTFPAAIALNVRIRYDGLIPPHHNIEASIETPAGSIAEKASSYTPTQRTNNGEVMLALSFTAYEAGTYTVRAMLSSHEVPSKKLIIRHAG